MARPPRRLAHSSYFELLLFAAASWPCVVVPSAAATTTWCVSRSDSSQQSLQRALDYACGAGADCSPILSTGLCYLPNTLQAHASYAFNSYYQRKGKAPGACDFSATATVAASDPSYGSCVYPSSVSTAGGVSTSVPTTTTIPNAPPLPLSPLDNIPDSSGAPSGQTDRSFGIIILVWLLFRILIAS